MANDKLTHPQDEDVATRPTTTHYLNAEFDLSLRPRPRQLERPRLVRQVAELSVQALLGTAEGDAALVHVDVPQDFLDYLARCGFAVPRLLRRPRIAPASEFRPFGWSGEAIELNRRHFRPVPHPPLDVVRRVNSRSFARELEADLPSGAPPGAVVESRGELQSFLSQATASAEWVIKAEHGHAGLANRRVRGSGLAEADRRFVDDRLTEDDRLVVERWFPRERDWCMVFEVPFDVATLRIHEVYATSDGALIGALFDPSSERPTAWRDEMAAVAERVASRLQDEGYFGPVAVDALSWCDGDHTKLRPLVDLNCRRSVSDGAYRLWQQVAGDRTFYYRFFNRRKLALPTDLPSVLAALGRRRYDRDARRGILLLSPLEVGAEGEAWRPGKLAVVFVAAARAEIRRLEEWFRGQFEA